ncbi:hypothetical protein JCM31739_10700 [Faecalimonas canis]
MEKILIQGTSSDAQAEIKKIFKDEWNLRYVTMFFEKTNFLMTKYMLLSNSVHLILEMKDGTQIQVESANCGYKGEGPRATVSILEKFGLEVSEVADVIYSNDAVKFVVEDGKIIWSTLKTDYLFYPRIRECAEDSSFYNKIPVDRNVRVDLEKRKVLLYNPQRVCWGGFMNMLTQLKNMEMEYYFGANSPLENGLYLGKGFNRELLCGVDKPDIEGIEHVNLVFYGEDIRVVCLIDRTYEQEVVESVYLGLTGERLFKKPNSLIVKKRDIFQMLWENLFTEKNSKIHGKKKIKQRELGNGLVRREI